MLSVGWNPNHVDHDKPCLYLRKRKTCGRGVGVGDVSTQERQNKRDKEKKGGLARAAWVGWEINWRWPKHFLGRETPLAGSCAAFLFVVNLNLIYRGLAYLVSTKYLSTEYLKMCAEKGNISTSQAGEQRTLRFSVLNQLLIFQYLLRHHNYKSINYSNTSNKVSTVYSTEKLSSTIDAYPLSLLPFSAREEGGENIFMNMGPCSFNWWHDDKA